MTINTVQSILTPIRRQKRKWFLPGILLIIFIICWRCGKPDSIREITIVYTNDLHGHILPEKARNWTDKTGGSANFISWLKEVREDNDEKNIPFLLLDAGDIYTGTVEGNISRGESIVRLMNLAGYDAMTLGNHEFDYGFYNLEQLAETADFPFLGANIRRQNTGLLPSFARPYVIKKYSGLSVGVLGVTLNRNKSINLSRNVGKLVFLDPISTVRTYRKLLRQEDVDLLIVLSHLGLEKDKKLAQAVPEIDLIIGGHSHDLLEDPIREGKRDTLICHAGSYGQFAGKINLQVDPDRDEIVDCQAEMFINRQYDRQADLEANQILEDIMSEVGNDYNRIIGIAMEDIYNYPDSESPLGNIIADAIRDETGAMAAFHNAYGIRYDLLKGEISRRDIFKILPFDNTLITMNLSGRDIRNLLEQSLTLHKGLLQISGIRVEYDMTRPEGKRVLKAEISGEPLRDEEYYLIATNGFLAEGGDYFQSFTKGINRRDTGILLRDAMEDYVLSHTPVYLPIGSQPRWWTKERVRLAQCD